MEPPTPESARSDPRPSTETAPIDSEPPRAEARPAPRRSPYYDDDDDDYYGRRRTRMYGVFPPLLLLFVAAVAWPAFQCYQLVVEKRTMATVQMNQAKPFDDATKMRGALEGIARDTALLASQGHAGARIIVDELGRRGVTIHPDAQPSTQPRPSK